MGVTEKFAYAGTTNPVELAWAAGFFDGEGSVFVNQGHTTHAHRPGKPRYPCVSPIASVCGCELQPLDRFARAVGGRVPTGPYKPRKVGHRPYYRWDACGRPSVHRVLSKLWPYLSTPKRQQALRVWETLARVRTKKSPILFPLPLAG